MIKPKQPPTGPTTELNLYSKKVSASQTKDDLPHRLPVNKSTEKIIVIAAVAVALSALASAACSVRDLVKNRTNNGTAAHDPKVVEEKKADQKQLRELKLKLKKAQVSFDASSERVQAAEKEEVAAKVELKKSWAVCSSGSIEKILPKAWDSFFSTAWKTACKVIEARLFRKERE
jgi:uncharacterized protein HemX